MWEWTDRVTLIEKGANSFLQPCCYFRFLTPGYILLIFQRPHSAGLRALFLLSPVRFLLVVSLPHCPLWTFPFVVVPLSVIPHEAASLRLQFLVGGSGSLGSRQWDAVRSMAGS